MNWTAKSWSNTNGEGDNSNVIVEYSLNESGSWTQVPSGSPGSFNVPSDPPYDPFSGSFTPAGTPAKVQLRVRTPNAWGNGSGGGQTTYTGVMTFPTDCDDLDLHAGPVCSAGGLDLTVKNNGSTAGSATVTYVQTPGPDGSVSTGSVAAGASKTVTIPILEGSSYTLSFTGDWGPDTKPSNKTGTRDCQTPAAPSATISWECGSQVTINLGNTGQESIDASIYRNDVFVKTVTVPAGGTSTTIAPSAENTTMNIKVTFSDAGTGTDVTKSFTVDCNKPAPTISVPVCATGGWNVTLGNLQGTDTATFTVNVNGTPTNVNVPAGQSTVHSITAAEGSTISLTITSGSGNPTYTNAALNRDCQKPAATAVFSCTAGGVVVNVSNTGSETASVSITGQAPVNVAPGGSHNVTIPVAEDADYNITVTSNGQTLASASGKRDCQKPAATVDFSCAEGGVVVTLTNSGEQATSVNVNGVPTNVPAGGAPVVVKIPVAEGEAYDITVLGQTAKGVRDCEKPAATVDFSCAEGGVVVTLTNTGDLDTTVPVNGQNVLVPKGGAPVVVKIPVLEGAPYDITVLGQTAKGVRDCEKPAAKVEFTCAEGGVVVTLTNTGELDTTVPVNGQDVLVPKGGAPVKVVIPVEEGASYDITVLGQTASGIRDCEKPEVEGYSVECSEGGVVVTLTNDGENDAHVTVDGKDVTIPAGETVEVLVEVEEGETYDFDIVVDGETIEVTGTYDCENPAIASATLECAEGGVVVLLTNDGETDTEVTVDGEPVEVPAGTTAEAPVKVVIPVAENAAYSIDILIDGETTTVAGTRQCEQPDIDSFSLECAEGGVVVLLTNDGELATTITVDGVEYEVPAGAGSSDENPAIEALVEVEEDAEYSFTVTGDELDETISGTADCEPNPDYVLELGGLCNEDIPYLAYSFDDGIEAELTAAAVVDSVDLRWYTKADGVLRLTQLDQPGEATIFWPGASADPEDWPGWIQKDDGSWVEGDDGFQWARQTLTLTASIDGEVVASADLDYPPATPTCDPRPPETVQGEVLTPGSLPTTGRETKGLLGLAGALLLAGAAFVAASRRRGEAL